MRDLKKVDFQEIMQHPGLRLVDPKFKNCVVEKDGHGLPRPRTGGFALTYKVKVGNEEWAVRCFHKLSVTRNVIHPKICDFIKSHPSRFFVQTEFQPHGILFEGNYYPISLMRWVKGETLGTFISNNFNDSQKIKFVTEQFLDVVDELNRLKIAHGDLSHSNIMVENQRMVLIDYDGMFIPSFRGSESSEIGNKNFQHPGRKKIHFNAEIDRFSEIIIYLALKTIAKAPSLYDKFGKGGDSLLFSASDIWDPDSSLLFSEIEKIPDLAQQIRLLKQICQNDISVVPTLSEFIRNVPVTIATPNEQRKTFHLPLGDLPIDGRNINDLIKNLDENVVVIGKVDAIKHATTITGYPYLFLNMGFFPNHTFTVVLWSEMLEMLETSGTRPDLFKSRWISVSGVIDLYNGKPQIVLDSPANITDLSEEEAKRRLSFGKPSGSKTQDIFISPRNKVRLEMGANEKIEKLNKLYGKGGRLSQKHKSG